MPSGNETKMVYPEAEKMVEILHTGSQNLQEVIEVMQQIAGRLEKGALLGDAGDAFVSALRSSLCPAIDRLAEKLKTESDYVQTEIYQMREAERKAQQLLRDN